MRHGHGSCCGGDNIWARRAGWAAVAGVRIGPRRSNFRLGAGRGKPMSFVICDVGAGC
jgi:hypothetical protein